MTVKRAVPRLKPGGGAHDGHRVPTVVKGDDPAWRSTTGYVFA